MKIIVVVFVFLASIVDAQVQGQKKVQGGNLFWKNSVTGINYTRVRYLPGTGFYLDTSAGTTTRLAGQGGAWKRIDNGADSCTVPAWLSSDSTNATAPVWKFELKMIIKATDVDSSKLIWRIQTRDNHIISGKRYWRPWTVAGKQAGSALSPIQDTILFPNLTGLTAQTKYEQRGLADLHGGTQFRLCQIS